MTSPFAEYREKRHQEAMAWKERTGGKVIGLFCCNVPEELIHAAGMLPVRLLAEHEETTEADLHFPVNVCPYPKGCFDLALKGYYDYLDGLVVPNVCDLIRAMFSFFNYNISIPYIRYLEIPQHITPEGIGFFTTELGRFQEWLEELSGRPIGEEALRHSIAVYNQSRALLRRLYDLKRRDPPLVLGSEAQDIVIASTIMPREEHNRLLTQFLEEAEERDPPQENGLRLFVSASMLDDSDLFRLIEECGASVVADDMPMGSRYFYNGVDESKEPLAALAERYLAGVACPRKMSAADRLAFVGQMLEGADVQGAIIHNLRACDCHLYEYPYLRDYFEERGLPLLFIKGEDTEAELEQQQAEIEAFLEIIES